MSSPPTIEPFKGTDWEECDDFIRAIRAAAWKEGKIQDPRWIADFASLHFSRKARTWYCRLPQDVRQDWEKLEIALSDRWTPPEDEDEPRIEPTPAAAPSLNRSDRGELPLRGVLKIVIDGSNTNYYLKLNVDGFGVMTTNATEAIRIRCSSSSNATLLDRIDGSRHSWLAIQWESSNPNLKNGSINYARLTFVDSLTLKASWNRDSPYQLASCTLSTDGEVIPVWENNDTSKITIGIFGSAPGAVNIAADPDAFSRSYPSQKKVKIFIEPID